MAPFMMENLKAGLKKAEEFLSLFDGAIYNWDFMGGVKEGRGVYKHPSGTGYDGEFTDDQIEGRGAYKYSTL